MLTDEQRTATAPPIEEVQHRPSLSIVIEWENVLLAGDDRAAQMLQALAPQIERLLARPISAEILVVVDSADDVDAIEMALRDFFPTNRLALSLRAIDAGGVKYHEKKNVGAAVARGDVIIFLDSDVIPEPDWLQRIFDSFSDPLVQVVGGATYLDHSGIYSSSIAAFWFFPPRNSHDELMAAETLFANNIAFRREVLLADQFPQIDQFRGQCRMLLNALKEKGIPVHQQSGARCSHPAPNGWTHFVRRAICEGYDHVVSYRRTNGNVPMRISFWTLRNELPKYFQRIQAQRADVGLSWRGALIARAIATGYVAAMMAGEQMTRISPHFVRRWFSI